jgi:hypothetical protein
MQQQAVGMGAPNLLDASATIRALAQDASLASGSQGSCIRRTVQPDLPSGCDHTGYSGSVDDPVDRDEPRCAGGDVRDPRHAPGVLRFPRCCDLRNQEAR